MYARAREWLVAATVTVGAGFFFLFFFFFLLLGFVFLSFFFVIVWFSAILGAMNQPYDVARKDFRPCNLGED